MTGLGIGRLFGIPLRLDISWLPMAGFITWSLATSYFPMFLSGQTGIASVALALLGTVCLFASLIAHELAHALTARAFGISTARITLFLFGGVAMMRAEPPTPKAEFWIAIAGPVMSLALALLAGAGSFLTSGPNGARAALVLFDFLFIVNMIFALFNLIPAFPMDGGRVLRAALWRQTRDVVRATRHATGISQVLALGAIFYGFWRVWNEGVALDAFWPILIGGFIFVSARRVYLSVRPYRP